MVLSKIFVSFLTSIVLITISNVAMADTIVSNGSGGNYSYELWQNTDNNRYYLKIWTSKSYGQREPSRITHSFESSREALDHFDCHYGDKTLPVCPN